MKRFGQVIKVKPEAAKDYIYHHQHPWPGVNKMIKECHLTNYSIYYRDGYLFSYYEYTGDDYEKDMEKMAADEETQRWWKLVTPMQDPIPTHKEGEWWADMEEVYHLN